MYFTRKIINDFLEEHKNSPIQGSTEWLSGRSKSIGGSEMAAVIGKNKYMNISAFIAQKIGLVQFSGNTATKWGNLFEKVTEKYTRHLILEDEVYSTGSVPNKHITVHKYSPDGISIISINGNYYIVLLEFKAPFSSIPNGIVPEHYLPQVLSGLCTIDICQKGIFVNNVYRKCSLEQIKSDKYHSDFHNDKTQFQSSIAHGVILFYMDIENMNAFTYDKYEEINDDDKDNTSPYSDDYDILCSDNDSIDNYSDNGLEFDELTIEEKIMHNINQFRSGEINTEEYDIIDLGKVDQDDFEFFLDLYKPSDNEKIYMQTKYSKVSFTDINKANISSEISIKPEKIRNLEKEKKFSYEKTIKFFINSCLNKDRVPIAVLPWKLYKSDILTVEKDTSYLIRHKDKIDYAIDMIKQFDGLSLNEKILKFQALFPKAADITKKCTRTFTVDDLRALD